MSILKTALNAAVMVISGKLASDGFEKAKSKLKEHKEQRAEKSGDPKCVGSVTQVET
jgi:hypothetical protein